jgi:hypothetical protein
MLIHARQAQVPRRFAPRLDRRATARARIRGSFAPDIALWLDGWRSVQSVGSTVAGIKDQSGRNASITQITASAQPLAQYPNQIKSLQFDGTNDRLETSTVALNSTNKLTIATLTMMPAITGLGGNVAEASANSNFVTTGVMVNRGYTGQNGNLLNYVRGNVGDSNKNVGPFSAGQWVLGVTVCDKTAVGAAQLTVYANGTLGSDTGAGSSATNTNTFGDHPWYLGGRGDNTFYYTGHISQIILLTRALTSSEATYLYTLISDLTGLAR